MGWFTLGQFELQHLLGRGAMGEVWGGIHGLSGRPVAVKVLGPKAVTNAQQLAAFKNEIRAACALEHPAIVEIFDHGLIDAEAAAQSQGRLTEGSPFLAMARADGGALSAQCGVMSWVEIQAVLMWLLDALAHAHARGVIHRDLKPSNVLLCDEAPGLKLTDFGLARAVAEVDAGVAAVAGTPGYMAPEQVTGRWRDQGPWTDLYALGAFAYHLASGQRPFRGANPRDTMRLQLVVPPPPFEPTCLVPDGFSDWIARLMARDPRERFQRAADAAWALWRLDPIAGYRLDTLNINGVVGGRPPALYWWAADDDDDDDDTGPLILSGADRTLRDLHLLGPSTLEMSALMSLDGEERPPYPPAWRRGVVEAWAPQEALGLGLYALRPAPMVGRVEERDRLWAMLREVVSREEAQVAIIEGRSGVGLSRLAWWLCQRGHEAGVATVLRAVHGPESGPADGLGPMLARHHQVVGLEPVALAQRLVSALADLGVTDVTEAHALAEALSPDHGEGDHSTVFDLGLQRPQDDPILRHLIRLARRRPVILWLDDVHWSLEGLRQVQQILRLTAFDDLALMVVMTLRTEGIPDEHALGSVAEIAAHPRATRLTLGPLSDAELNTLLVMHLGLTEGLAQRLAAQTQGSPTYATQAVGDWSARGLLIRTPEGYDLAPGVEIELPEDVHSLWLARLEALLDTPEQMIALEIAATLGQHIDPEEWAAACAAADLLTEGAVLDRLSNHRLVARNPGGPEARWSFVHGVMRDSLLRHAIERGRAQHHHRACAEALAGLIGGRIGPDISERLGRHLHGGGHFEAALAPLIRGAKRAITRGLHGEATRLLDLRDEALEALGVGGDDPRWGVGWIVRAEALLRASREDEGLRDQIRAWMDQILLRIEDQHWQALHLSALELSGRLALLSGDLADAQRRFEGARREAEALRDLRGVGNSLLGLARIYQRLGYVDEVEGCAGGAVTCFEELGELDREARALYILAEISIHRGDLDRARACCDRAMAIYTAQGHALGIARCQGTLGHLALIAGEHLHAEALYRRAMEILRLQNFTPSPLLKLGHAEALLGCDRRAEGREILATVNRHICPRGRPWLLLRARTLRLLSVDPHQRESLWRRELHQICVAVGEHPGADGDLAWALEMIAGELPLERRAAPAEAAASLWARLARTSDAQRARATYVS